MCTCIEMQVKYEESRIGLLEVTSIHCAMKCWWHIYVTGVIKS
jgi:hypothetical protein